MGANAISMTGNVMALLAIPWFVLQTTKSPALTGVAAAVNFLPTVLGGIFGGTFVDRLGYKRASIIADLASGVTVALIPLLYSTVGLEFWQLLTLVFFGALLDSPGTTARRALVPEIASRAGWSLEGATSSNQVVERGSRLMGSPLAGLLIAIVGPSNVLWVNAATFGVSALMILLAIPREPGIERHQDEKYFSQLKEGIQFLLNARMLRAIVFTVTATNFLDGISIVLYPVYAKEIYSSPVALGMLLGAAGGGSVLGALLYARWARRLSRRTVFATCFVGVVAQFPIYALFPPIGIAIGASAFSGLAAGPLNPIIETIELEQIPIGMRGRVLGVIHAAAWMSIPLGVLIGGSLIELLGLRTTLILTAVAYLAATLSLWINPAIKEMDEPVAPKTVEDVQEIPQARV
jgi:MFS family permease